MLVYNGLKNYATALSVILRHDSAAGLVVKHGAPYMLSK